MPRYHFHLRTPDGLQWDEEGVPFAGLEVALPRCVPGHSGDGC